MDVVRRPRTVRLVIFATSMAVAAAAGPAAATVQTPNASRLLSNDRVRLQPAPPVIWPGGR